MGSKDKSNFAAHQAGTDASPCKNAALAVRWYDPTGARPLFSPQAIARQRHATLQSFKRLKVRRGVVKAAAMVGASVPTLWRWQKQFAARGLAGLQPKPASGGRKSPFSKVRFPSAAAREIERLIISTGNLPAAWQQFAGNPLCPPLVARHIIQTGKVPPRFADIGRVNPVKASCYISADGRRLLIRLPSQGTITASLVVPENFKLSNLKATR